MKKTILKGILTACGALFIPSLLMAQGILEGNIKNKSGETLGFSVVRVKNVGKGAAADEAGHYRIEKLDAGTYQVVYSFVGYEEQTQNVVINNGATTTLDVVMSSSNSFDEVVITGLMNPKSALESSISISTITQKQIDEISARSTAEIFRSIPGIRSEASAGEGNTNITVRGVPIATGGSKYLQLQEDGLPVLQFGDIAFGTADQFTKFDYNIGRIEAVRGGSASTASSNSPAGVINFISKTGDKQGGSVGSTFGIDYRTHRTDFEYGAPIAKNMTFHVGGYYKQGDSPRETGFTSNYGGQIKANMTRYFEKGYARVFLKYLDDRTPAYMPMPIMVSGTNDNPVWESVPGFSATHGALQSPYLMSNLSTDGNGSVYRSNVADGMHSVSKSIGTEFNFELGNEWYVTNRARMAWNNGSFTAPFTAGVDSMQNIANGIAPGYTSLTYASTGDAVAANANGNGLLMRTHLFDTRLNNFNNFTNDFNISKDLGKAKINVGVYKAYQAISMSWLWNTYLQDVSDSGSQLVNVSKNDTMYTDNGLVAYGVPAWGNCCHRNIDTYYDITAPYANVEFEVSEKITADASVRFDNGHVTGSFAGGDGQTSAIDMNGDGNISIPEQNVATVDNQNIRPVNYDYKYTSYSAGVNYLLNKEMSLFGRYSKGGRANADRLLFGPYINANGSANADLSADMVTQAELGYKMRKENFTFNATAFRAVTEEQNYEATTQRSLNREYTAMGIELDGTYQVKGFAIRGGVTLTDAEISKDALNAELVGNRPRRQAGTIYNFSPSYTYKNHTLGISAIGTTSSYAQDNNQLVMPGYTYMNVYLNLRIADGLNFMINANNVLDTMGITESEAGSITANRVNYVAARSITGRSTSATLRFTF